MLVPVPVLGGRALNTTPLKSPVLLDHFVEIADRAKLLSEVIIL